MTAFHLVLGLALLIGCVVVCVAACCQQVMRMRSGIGLHACQRQSVVVVCCVCMCVCRAKAPEPKGFCLVGV